jgi:23S rRNA pseudouridine2605 synthase/16S rRNA pseudouridine516 synthase
VNKPHDDSIRRRGGGRPRGGRGHFEQTGRREHRDRRGAHFDQDTGDDRRTAPGRKQRDGQRGERTQRAQAERRQRHAHDPRARRSGRGGRGAERGLSPQARARLRILRDEYDPWDDDPVDPDEERDTYVDVPGGIRLQKALAQAGVASRRACEELIAAGRVSVDGQIVRRFGARVDPEKSEIRVDGMRVVTSQNLRYYALNKPRGVVSTMFDPEGRPTVGDYAAQIGPIEERLFHVGRLDTDTEGLILLTNDGELANRLTHPRYKVTKTYLAKVPGPVPRDVIRQIRKGVELDDGFVKVDSFRVIDNIEPKALVEIRLHEGRKHIVRRLMKAVGHPVSDLARTQIGPVGLNNLKSGTIRALTSQEVSELYTAAGM